MGYLNKLKQLLNADKLDLMKPEVHLKLMSFIINRPYYSIEYTGGRCRISNGQHDFIDDGYDTRFSVSGSDFYESLYCFLIGWMQELTSYRINGEMTPYEDTSHFLTKDHCYYPNGYDEYIKDRKNF